MLDGDGEMMEYKLRLILAVGLLTGIMAGCGTGSPSESAATSFPFPTPVPPPQYSITFLAHAPADTDASDKVLINVLDEITGLALNPTVYEMQPIDSGIWSIQLSFPRGELVQYRYSLESGAIESDTAANLIDFRTYLATGNSTVEDTVAHWSGTDYHGTTGIMRGLVRDSSTGLAIPGLIVTTAGKRGFTDASGNFSLSGIPTGRQVLVAYDMEGRYKPFVQEAIIADGQETPADLKLTPTPTVNVTFHVYLPADTPANATVRLVGSLYNLGNTYLPGLATTMVDPARAPQLSRLSDGSYGAVINLPVGALIRYKFTLGDGFWNAERGEDGRFLLRTLLVPEHDAIFNHAVSTWHSGNQGTVAFYTRAPDTTPTVDSVSIQLSPFQGIWMRPIPMWPTGANQWSFSLFAPMEWPGQVTYRYCRNGVCGIADDANAGRQFQPTSSAQTITDTISAWTAWPDAPAASWNAPATAPRNEFRFGAVLASAPWSPPYEPGLVNLASLHVGSVTFAPRWYLGANAPLPEMRYLPELASPLRQDLLNQMSLARSAGMQTVVAPNLTALSGTTKDWWGSAPRNAAWWDAFFMNYGTVLNTYADIAQQAGAQELVIADADMLPALPGQPNTPSDADVRWRVLTRTARLHFSGKLAIELPLTDKLAATPTFLDEINEVLIRVSGPLAVESDSPDAWKNSAATLLDSQLADVRKAGKPILIEAAYASAGGADAGCPQGADNACMLLDALEPGSATAIGLAPNYDAQTRAYIALLAASVERDWIAGFFTWGYFAPVALRDGSVSIHGKPVETVLAKYFTR
jgi:hypothetical protein